jgi:hypothetical protein
MRYVLLAVIAGVGLLGVLLVIAENTGASRRKSQTMHITFRRTGGFFAGRALEGTIDVGASEGKLVSGQYTQTLSAHDVQLIDEGVKAIETLKGDLRDLQKGADQYQYEITIQSPGHKPQKIVIGDTSETSIPVSDKAKEFFTWVRNQITNIPRQASPKTP